MRGDCPFCSHGARPQNGNHIIRRRFPQKTPGGRKAALERSGRGASPVVFAGLSLGLSWPLLISPVSSRVQEPCKLAHPKDKPTQPYTNLMHGRIYQQGVRPADAGTQKELTRTMIALPAIYPHPCTPPVPWVSASSHISRRPKQTVAPPPATFYQNFVFP